MWVHLTNAGSPDLTKYDGEYFYQYSIGQNYISVQLADTDLSIFSSIKIRIKYPDNSISINGDLIRERKVYPYDNGSPYWVKNNEYNVATFYFNQAGWLAQSGECVATITFYQGGSIYKTGTINFYVTQTVFDEEQTITTTQYEQLEQDIEKRWKRFLGTTEERLAAEKDQYTIYADTTTGLDYIWNGSSFIALGEHSDLAFDAGLGTNHINSIYYKENTYYPTRVFTFTYIAHDEKIIPISALSGLSLSYNTNYLYFNTDNQQLYKYRETDNKLVLIGALQNIFTLTEVQENIYRLASADLSLLVGALESHSTNYVIFNFSGGYYDGRRYLMNYKYNASTQAYNLVCVDMDISINNQTRETKLEYVSKFTLENIKLGQTNLDGEWYEATTDTAQAVDSDTFIIGSTTYNIPSDVSDLNNDAGYLTASSSTITSMQTAINGKQDTLSAGANITLINNEISATDTTYESKEAVNGGTDLSLVTTGEKYTWNNKQNPLPSTSGNNNKYLHINDTTGNLEWSEVGFITGAFTYIGTTTTQLSDGSTTNPITIGGESVTATNGNVVFYGDSEFVWTGSAWEELGNKNQATSSVLGNIKLGSDTTIDNTASKVYPIQLNSSGQAFVYVPWTDNNTTYNIATSLVAGLVKSSTTGTTANRDYVVQVNNDGTMKVNVPWTDTDTTYSVATGSVLGLVKSQTTGTTANRDYAVEVNANGTMKVNVPWVNTTYTSESAAQGGTTVSLVTTGEKYTWNNKQDTLSSASVNTGTIETAIGFNNNGELVKGSIPSGVDNISIVNALPTTSNAQNNILYKLNNDLYALTETEQVAPVISYSNGTLTVTCDYDAESIELYADNTLIDTISINGGNN